MCRSNADGGRRCSASDDPTMHALVNPRRRARDNHRLAARARADGRKADAARYEQHAQRAEAAAVAIRDAAPAGPIHATEQHPIRTLRDQKALLAAFVAEGITDDSEYRKLYRTVSTGKNDAVILARDFRGRPIGIIGYRRIGSIDIPDLWIISDAQRSGAGTELLAQVAVEATHTGARRDVKMTVSSALHDAQPFYAKHGATFRAGSQTGTWAEPYDVAALAAKARLANREPRALPTREDHIDDVFRREIAYAKSLRDTDGTLPDWYTNPESHGSLWNSLGRTGTFTDADIRGRFAARGITLPTARLAA